MKRWFARSLIGVGDDDQIIRIGAQTGVFLANGDGTRTAYVDLVDAADDQVGIPWPGNKNDRETFTDRGKRSVLELGREHAFAMRVGDLFQLQRAFQCDG